MTLPIARLAEKAAFGPAACHLELPHPADGSSAEMGATTFRFLVVLSPNLTRLTAELRASVMALARRPTKWRAAEAARLMGMSRRTLDRRFEAAGLAGASRFFLAAFIAAAWESATERERGIANVARGFGYRRMKTFQKHTRNIFGSSPRRVLNEMSDAEVAGRLAAYAARDPHAVETKLPVAPRARDLHTSSRGWGGTRIQLQNS